MKRSKFNKKMIAFICAIAMVVAGIVYTPATTKADAPDYSSLTFQDLGNNNNNEFAASLKGSQIAIAEGSLNFNVKQYQNAGFRELYLACAGNIPVEAKVNGDASATNTLGDQVFVPYAADVFTYEYNVLEITFDTQTVIAVIYCPANEGKGTYEEIEDPSAETTTANPWRTVANSDNEYFYNNSTKVNISNVDTVQSPPWANGNKGIYITVPAGISEVSINGETEGVASIQGAGFLAHLSAMTLPINEVNITYDGTKQAYIQIKNINVADWESLTQMAPTAKFQDDSDLKVLVEWSAVEGADSYTTFINSRADGKEANTGSWIFKKRNQTWADNIARSDDSSIILDYGNTYTFYVVAYDGKTPIATGSVNFTIPEQGEVGGDVVFTNAYRETNLVGDTYYSELFANWDAVPGAAGYKSYINEEKAGNEAKAANGWIWSDQNAPSGSTDRKVDTVYATKDGNITIKANESYKLIVVAYDAKGVEIGRGEITIDAASEPIIKEIDTDNYKANETAPKMAGQVFAGWYSDATCETVFEGTEGSAYAKFIDEKVLSTKFQIANDGSAIRFLSTVDTTDYQEVGFVFSGTYGTKTISEKTKTTTSLYRTIKADGNTTLPSVFCDSSQYFFAYTVRGLTAETDMTWSVTPFYVTSDGTTVLGITGTYPVE